MARLFIFTLLIVTFILPVWPNVERPDYWSEIQAANRLQDSDPEAALRRLTSLHRKKNKKFGVKETGLLINETAPGAGSGYTEPLTYGKNYLLLRQAMLAEWLAFSSESPVWQDFNRRYSELKKKRDKRISATHKQYKKNVKGIGYLLKKKKTFRYKKTKKKKKVFKKKIAVWRVPAANKKKYNSQLSAFKKRKNGNVSAAHNQFDSKVRTLVKKRQAAQSSKIKQAISIYRSGLLQKAERREALVVQGLVYVNLANLLAILAGEKAEAPSGFTKRDVYNVLNEPLWERSAKTEQAQASDFLKKQVRRKFRILFNEDTVKKHRALLKDIFDWQRYDTALIKLGEAEHVLALYRLESSIDAVNLDADYRSFYLALNSELYSRAETILGRIKTKVSKSKAPEQIKTYEYVRYANQKANLLFARGKFEQCADYHEEIRAYTKLVERRLGETFQNKLATDIDPVSGYNYTARSNATKKYLARYYQIRKEDGIRVESEYRPFAVKKGSANESELKELAGVIKEKLNNWKGGAGDKVLPEDKVDRSDKLSKKSNAEVDSIFRLQLVLSLVQLEFDPRASTISSEDVMYRTQARQMSMVEYYATLLNGFGKLKRRLFRQARVDFTKVNTILWGSKSFNDLSWVVGYGRAMTELEEYKRLNLKKRAGRRTRRAREKSLRYLKRHLKLTLRSVARVRQNLNIFRLRSFLPYHVSPRRQLQATQKVARLYGHRDFARLLKRIEGSWGKFDGRNIFARFLSGEIKREQFRWLVTGKRNKDELLNNRRRLARFTWNPTLTAGLESKLW